MTKTVIIIYSRNGSALHIGKKLSSDLCIDHHILKNKTPKNFFSTMKDLFTYMKTPEKVKGYEYDIDVNLHEYNNVIFGSSCHGQNAAVVMRKYIKDHYEVIKGKNVSVYFSAGGDHSRENARVMFEKEIGKRVMCYELFPFGMFGKNKAGDERKMKKYQSRYDEFVNNLKENHFDI